MSTTERASFTDLLAERGVLIADGATGTNYQTMGMEPGLAPEEWLFQAPERVVELHRAFVDAGADIVLTCTFGATPLRLTEGSLVGKVREVNLRAAELAREGAGADRLVAGSLGPTGHVDRAVRAAQPRGRDGRVRAAGERAGRGRRRPARAGDDLRRRGGRLGRRRDPERHQHSARRVVLIRHGNAHDDGAEPDRRGRGRRPDGDRRRGDELRPLARGRRSRRRRDPRGRR